MSEFVPRALGHFLKKANPSSSRTNFVSHLEGAIDGARLDPNVQHGTHKGRPVLVRYDLESIAKTIDTDSLSDRQRDMWRLHELLPHVTEPVTLGESQTSVLPCPNLARHFGLQDLRVKDESSLPTGSFKSRGLAVAVTMALRFGTDRIAIPTAGNAGGALAAYAARAGLEAFVFMPADTPRVNQAEAALSGANVFLINGLINDCGHVVARGKAAMGWFDVSTLKEPYRLEGKKTMGFELAEQSHWELPDVILYPTGGGTGLIGMWKAFRELAKLGWIDSSRLPRMIAVQSDGCAPIVRAFEAGSRFAEHFRGASTVARGIRVPSAVGDFLILDALRESGGRAVAVREGQILQWMRTASGMEGIAFCPESAACVGALEILIEEGSIERSERIVVFNCAAGNKYADVADLSLPVIDPTSEIDWEEIGNTSERVENGEGT